MSARAIHAMVWDLVLVANTYATVAPPTDLAAQAPRSVWSGVYTESQRNRGRSLYIKECSSCHGEAFKGGEAAPGLAGAGFRKRWTGHSLGDLYDKISLTMPPNVPGRLTAEQNADIIAAILDANLIPSGTQDLSSDGVQLSLIHIDSGK